MTTSSDFSWEYIINQCNFFRGEYIILANPQNPKLLVDRADGLIAAVAKLCEHPKLEKLVPMMSMMTLRWFPSKGYELNLNSEENKTEYAISVFRGSVEIEKKVVALNELANEIYGYIVNLRD